MKSSPVKSLNVAWTEKVRCVAASHGLSAQFSRRHEFPLSGFRKRSRRLFGMPRTGPKNHSKAYRQFSTGMSASVHVHELWKLTNDRHGVLKIDRLLA